VIIVLLFSDSYSILFSVFGKFAISVLSKNIIINNVKKMYVNYLVKNQKFLFYRWSLLPSNVLLSLDVLLFLLFKSLWSVSFKTTLSLEVIIGLLFSDSFSILFSVFVKFVISVLSKNIAINNVKKIHVNYLIRN